MDTCPICSCLLTENSCVMCGYKLKATITEKYTNRSVFDIFDFIDNKPFNNTNENVNKNINNNTTIDIDNSSNNDNDNNTNIEQNKISKKYEKNEYKQVKYNKNKTNINTSYPKTTAPTLVIKNKLNFKTILKILRIILYITIFLIKPNLFISILVLKGVIKNATEETNKI